MRDEAGREIIYWIGRNAGVCPDCGNWNAMLEKPRMNLGLRYEDLECRDCGHWCRAGHFVDVKIDMDTDNREYTGIACDGTVVVLGSIDGNGLTKYLKAYPTPDKW